VRFKISAIEASLHYSSSLLSVIQYKCILAAELFPDLVESVRHKFGGRFLFYGGETAGRAGTMI